MKNSDLTSHRWMEIAVVLYVFAVGATPMKVQADDGAIGKSGLLRVHFESPFFTQPRGWAIEPQINRESDATEYSEIWLGRVRVPTSQEITFQVEAELARDPARIHFSGLLLTIGGKSVIDSWDTVASEGTCLAKEGQELPLELKAYHLGKVGSLRLFWAWKGHPRELVPAEAFLHTGTERQKAVDLTAGKTAVDVPVFKPGERVGRIYKPVGPDSGRLPEGSGAIKLKPGPHLFLDDYLVESSRKVTREPVTLQRDPEIPNPIITGAEDEGDRNCQPFLNCLRDPQTSRFRFWYSRSLPGYAQGPFGVGVGYLEGNDGVHWERPHRVLPDCVDTYYCAGVIDEGPEFPAAAHRFKCAFLSKGNGYKGPQIWSSPDGLNWKLFGRGPRGTGENILHLAYDSARQHYVMTFDIQPVPADGYVGRARSAWSIRRMVGQSTSRDLKQWTPPRRIIMPEDEGITEFYSIGGLQNRGELMVGMLKVLRDDLPCDPDGPIQGIGYTVVAWTHDGENWLRERVPLVDRDHAAEAWDHAMAWVDVQLPVGDEVYLYYGGYKKGHKSNPTVERQVGLMKTKRDRYVAREAGDAQGRLETPLVTLEADRMSVNVQPMGGGEVRVQIVDADRRPLEGFRFDDCQPITDDAVAAAVRWKRPLSELKGKPVHLQFALKLARLYAFELE